MCSTPKDLEAADQAEPPPEETPAEESTSSWIYATSGAVNWRSEFGRKVGPGPGTGRETFGLGETVRYGNDDADSS